MKKISIIIPVYYNQDNLLPLYADLKEKVLTKLKIDYELIFVDDGSKDNSYKVMLDLAKLDNKIKTIKLYSSKRRRPETVRLPGAVRVRMIRAYCINLISTALFCLPGYSHGKTESFPGLFGKGLCFGRTKGTPG